MLYDRRYQLRKLTVYATLFRLVSEEVR